METYKNLGKLRIKKDPGEKKLSSQILRAMMGVAAMAVVSNCGSDVPETYHKPDQGSGVDGGRGESVGQTTQKQLLDNWSAIPITAGQWFSAGFTTTAGHNYIACINPSRGSPYLYGSSQASPTLTSYELLANLSGTVPWIKTNPNLYQSP